MVWFLTLVFGACGVGLRYALDNLLARPESFPWITLIVNMVGCFLGGIISGATILESSLLSFLPSLRIPLLVGFCGGFTTFSAYSLQCLRLGQKGIGLEFLIYFLGSPILGLAACAAGLAMATRL
jgi:fluoride exporter